MAENKWVTGITDRGPTFFFRYDDFQGFDLKIMKGFEGLMILFPFSLGDFFQVKQPFVFLGGEYIYCVENWPVLKPTKSSCSVGREKWPYLA